MESGAPASGPSAGLDPVAVLGPAGALSRELKQYESRPQQLAMAAAVAQAIAEGSHAVIEAPTGVGKSFAYLVPAIQHALATGKKVVVSTGTIALQEQLIRKDIPLLQKVFPELRAVLVKGRQNYVSLRRLSIAADGQQTLFETRDDATALREVATWAKDTDIGDLADLGYDPPPQVWRQVQSDRTNCLGRKCPTYNECYFYKARKEMEEAHLLVVNHHLYFSDLSLRDEHAGMLPAHEVVIFDEAHALEDIATDHLGTSISEAQVRFWLDGLWSAKSRGLLADPRFEAARETVEYARQANQTFWKDVALLGIDRGEETMRLTSENQVPNPLSPALDAVARALDAALGRVDEENDSAELKAQISRAAAIAGSLRAILEVGSPTSTDEVAHVHYAHVPRGKGGASLSMSPLSVAELLKERLFSKTRTVVLTSATLAADDSERFLFLRKRLGIEGGIAKRLDSPFDYQTQATLILNQTPLDPNSERYENALAAWLTDYLTDPARGRVGGSFVLFTSYRQLLKVHDLVRPALDRTNRFVLRHGDGMGRAQMLDLFKRVGDAVLFGTSSFWEGVDVPGDALKHVIITKLPFEVPNHPVVEARHHEIQRRGGNPFMERTVPEAIIKLKQGFGRLIRTKADTGHVAILDHRVLTKAYGRYFLRALPQCRIEMTNLEPGG
jgi:ATP-dependent DNA helicase DinG